MNFFLKFRSLRLGNKKFIFHSRHLIRKIHNILIGLTDTIINQIDQPINISNVQILQQISIIVIGIGMVMLILGKMTFSFVFLAGQLLEVLVRLKFDVLFGLGVEKGFACVLLLVFLQVCGVNAHRFVHFLFGLFGTTSFFFLVCVGPDFDFFCGGGLEWFGFLVEDGGNGSRGRFNIICK